VSTFALIADGQVVQLGAAEFPVHAALTWVEVSAVSPAPQPGWTATQNGSAWTFTAPAVPTPTPAQQAQAALVAGISITSTSGGWTATFPCLTDATGANMWTMVLAEQAALSLSGNATFADGAATVQWPDAGGALHAMTSAQFQAFMKALGAFVAGCRNVINGVAGAMLPAAAATIS